MKKQLFYFLLPLALFSCKKKNDTPSTNNTTPKGRTCYVKTMLSSDPSQNANVTYDNNNHLLKLVGDSFEIDFAYDANGHANGYSVIVAPDTLASYTLDLDAHGKPLVSHEYSSFSGTKAEDYRTSYTYGSNNLPSREDNYDVTSGTATLSDYELFSYDSSGNVTKSLSYDASGNLTSTETFTYDNHYNASYFPGIFLSPQTWSPNNMTDDLYKDGSGNVISHNTYSYTYNSDGYPVSAVNTDVVAATTTTTTFSYTCK